MYLYIYIYLYLCILNYGIDVRQKENLSNFLIRVQTLRAFASIFLKDRVFFAFKQKSLSGFCIQILLDW